MTSTSYRTNAYVNGQTLVLYVSDCANCGVIFGMTTHFESRLRENGKTFYCPNGHSMTFGESAIAKAQRLQAAAERRENSAQIRASAAYDQAKAAERSARAYRGQVTRMKNKITAGVCPVGNCRRHFNDVQAHIKTQHKSWAHEHPEVLS